VSKLFSRLPKRRLQAAECIAANVEGSIFAVSGCAVECILSFRMEDFSKEEWRTLYETALLELKHAKITGRIEDARLAIVARLEKLQTLDTLHPEERLAISDAKRALDLLEREEMKWQSQDKQRLIEEAAEKLKAAEPAIKRL
jgi:hypothetical protein